MCGNIGEKKVVFYLNKVSKTCSYRLKELKNIEIKDIDIAEKFERRQRQRKK